MVAGSKSLSQRNPRERPESPVGPANVLTMENIKVLLKTSNRSRHIRITIHRDQRVELTVPSFVSKEKAIEFLNSKENWIKDKLAYYTKFSDAISKKEDEAFYLGKTYKINITSGVKPNVILNDSLNVTLKNNTQLSLKKTLSNWYKDEARKKITDLVQVYSSAYSYNVNKIRIGRQKTRWGSCSKCGNLNFNYKLIMAPEEVIRYVVLHELTHLSEMNHSKRFWGLMSERCPEYREHRKWLRKQGGWLSL